MDFIVDFTPEQFERHVEENLPRYSAYDIAMENLANEYKRVWNIADREKELTGKVSEETDNLLITIEMEMEMLENAV